MIIHRPKLRWSPKLRHIMHRRICPSIRDRLRRWREAVNAVTLRDDNRPKIKNLMCCGGVCVTVRVPVAFRNKCERVTGPQPERVRSIFAGVNATRTSGTGPERDRNANRNRCEHGLCVWRPEQITVILCVRRAATSQPGRIAANLFVRRPEKYVAVIVYVTLFVRRVSGALKICRSDGVRKIRWNRPTYLLKYFIIVKKIHYLYCANY